MFMSEHLMSNREYTPNELNNIVYLCMKYTFGKIIPSLDNPTNPDIYSVLLSIHDDVSDDNIVLNVIDFVRSNHMGRDDADMSRFDYFMRFLIREFNKLPEELRNDLGEDKASDDFVTKH